VLSAVALPAGVVRLDVRRPTGFVYTAGDYAFIRIPAIARHEWHPFTLTSAPEDAEVLTFHIRALGNWTTALHTLAKREAAGGIEVHVDGPYGAPATHLPESEHAVAIAAGIGVTPFAAILRSILLRAQMGHGRLRKLHFVWLSREQESFGWFTALLLRLEALDLFDIRIYMTKGRGDLDGGALDLARELDHERRGGDLVTGLAAKTTFGRPDFPALLREFVAEADLPPPDVYFCGPAAISGQLQRLCRAYGLAYREERF
jgi:predicted ferric reductase